MGSDYLSWGRVSRPRQTIFHPAFATDAPALLDRVRGSALPYGMGRSYGDSCLNPGGALMAMRGLDRLIAFDPQTGVLEAEAGVSLADILAHVTRLAEPGGAWFLPVSPGTKFVTLGGAVANDVHGKNHHSAGCFGNHVLSFRLLRSDGVVRVCSPTEHPDLFAATIGGLGLTGVVLSVQLQLMRVPSLWLEVEDIRFADLAAFERLSVESVAWDYTVAWTDCLARGAALGRGIFTRARHSDRGGPPPPVLTKPRRTVPVDLPGFALNGLSVAAFNALYWRRAPWKPVRRVAPYEAVFYPLDAIGHWNRIYGARGFHQYQCVVPSEAIAALLSTIAGVRQGSFLAVLKTMGSRVSPGMLSFPQPGTTLALDFPDRGSATYDLLNQLDRITAAAGGRIYPAKDGRVSAGDFQRYYPQWRDFCRLCGSAFLLLLLAPSQRGQRKRRHFMRRVVIFGATSAIAQATARLFAARGDRLFLVARSAERLDAVAGDLRTRGASQVSTATADLALMDGHAALVAQAHAALDGIEAVLIAHGTLGDQAESQQDGAALLRELTTNFLSPASLLHAVAPVMQHGTIAVIGSVAGDRGRQSNYVYGAAKGGLRVFAQGLRHRLAGTGVDVVLVQPGFVDTPMTAAVAKGGPLWAKPERVAQDIVRAMDRGGPAILYTPWFWQWIMLIIRLVPEPIFRRTKL